MSYDITLCDPVTHEILKADSVHFIAGGIRIVGGTEKLMRYVTRNYRKFYRRNDVLGKKEFVPSTARRGLKASRCWKRLLPLWAMIRTMTTIGTRQKAMQSVRCIGCLNLQRCVLTVCGTEIERRKGNADI